MQSEYNHGKTFSPVARYTKRFLVGNTIVSLNHMTRYREERVTIDKIARMIYRNMERIAGRINPKSPDMNSRESFYWEMGNGRTETPDNREMEQYKVLNDFCMWLIKIDLSTIEIQDILKPFNEMMDRIDLIAFGG